MLKFKHGPKLISLAPNNTKHDFLEWVVFNLPSLFLVLSWPKLVIYDSFYYWWLLESQLSGCFCLFAPKLWEWGRDLWMIFCQSVSTVWIVSTLIGGGETETLTALHSEAVEMLKLYFCILALPCALTLLEQRVTLWVKHSLPIICWRANEDHLFNFLEDKS